MHTAMPPAQTFLHAYHARFTSISDIVQEICGFPRIWFESWCNGWLWARLIVLSATMDGRLGDSLGVGGCGGIMVASTAGMGFTVGMIVPMEQP
ncbi:hypothetical protein D6C80_03142 [Aureobasidium pullulans]|nr:hypothetical protein D6C80_03142 [Aureobasidium pullulans]